MKKFWGLILFLFLFCAQTCHAAKFDFLILPNDLFLDKKNNLIFEHSASLIGSDIANYYNQHPDMSAVPISQVKTYLEKAENYRLKKEVQKLLNDYQINYVMNFATIQKLASQFNTKQVLMITCNMDTQNYITRRTLWDALNIPGATVIDPAYRLSTQVSLVDANNQIVLWQHNYQKLISSRESRMITPSMNDTSEQLEKVKKYSTKFLAPQVVQETQLALLNMSPYQNLNLHPEIVKPNYVSIDKIKIDSKRAGVRSAKYVKNQSILAGQTIATEAVKLSKKGKKEFIKLKENASNKIDEKKLLLEEQNNLSVEEQIRQIQEKEQAKLAKKQEKLRLKEEKRKIKEQLKAAKKQAKLDAEMQLQQEKEISEIKVEKINNKKKSSKSWFKNKRNVKNSEEIDAVNKIKPEIEVQTQQKNQEIKPVIVPQVKIIQKEYKPIPFVRTKPILKEFDYTINDY